PVSATVAALRGERGEATHFVSIERDISEERRLREQLIYSERLSAVGQLVAGVAHELNNPLQGVMGQVELLIDTEDRPATRNELHQIRRSGERAATIVRKLLTFARHSALERSVADLNEIVRSTIALRANDLRAAGIAVEEDYAEELPLIIVNRGEIQQAVLNLLLNAEEALRAARRRCGRRSPTIRDRCSSRSPTTAPACRTRWRTGSSSRSSPPEAAPKAKGPASGCRSASASPPRTAGRWCCCRRNAARASP